MQQRKSAREIAALQHEHELSLARGERLFERRAAAYEAMLNFLQIWWERIADTEPIWREAGQPPPSEAPSPGEWRPMYVRLETYGSVPVAALYDQLSVDTRAFFNRAIEVRSAKVAQGERNRLRERRRLRKHRGGPSRRCAGLLKPRFRRA